MDRIDTKFVMHRNLLPELLEGLKDNYKILEVNNQRLSEYESHYFDTSNYAFYLQHHNQKRHRFKVRYRHYTNSNTSYFEIKERKHKRMVKHRFQVQDIQPELTKKELNFVKSIIGDIQPLQRNIQTHYQRITLVNEGLKERFTLDFSIHFSDQDHG